ncbi:MAG: hypothetical protein ABFC57_06210 [Veillonellales bacterium]
MQRKKVGRHALSGAAKKGWFTFRATDAERTSVDALARQHGLSVNEFLLFAAAEVGKNAGI